MKRSFQLKAIRPPKRDTAILLFLHLSLILSTWYCHTTLLQTIRRSNLKFFTGDVLHTQVNYSNLNLTLVISHCNESMTWMQDYLKDFPIKNITIYSKCNATLQYAIASGSNIIRLPNVGRCDHSYAHWMKNMDPTHAKNNNLVLFFKASRYLYQPDMYYRPIKEMIQIALNRGFACEASPSKNSIYHKTSLLRKFNLSTHRGVAIKSHYDNMGQWLDDMGIDLPLPFTSVCYGGNFLIKASSVYEKRDIVERIEENLRRGDSIEGECCFVVWF